MAVNDVFMKLATLAQDPPQICRFNDDAQGIWDCWSQDFSKKLQEMTEDWQAIKGKSPALLAKLALIFHLIEEAENCKSKNFSYSSVITSPHLKRAIKWLDYLDNHMKKIILFGSESTKSNGAQSLLGNLKKFEGSFAKQQLAQKGWSNLTTKNSRDEALDELESKGYIRWVESPRKQFEIHPDYR